MHCGGRKTLAWAAKSGLLCEANHPKLPLTAQDTNFLRIQRCTSLKLSTMWHVNWFQGFGKRTLSHVDNTSGYILSIVGSCEFTFLSTPFPIWKSKACCYFLPSPPVAASSTCAPRTPVNLPFSLIEAAVQLTSLKTCSKDFLVKNTIPSCWGIVLPIHMSKDFNQTFWIYPRNSGL